MDSVTIGEVRKTILQLVEAWNLYDVESAVSLFAPDCLEEDIAVLKPQNGAESVRRTMSRYLSAFPGLQLEILDLLVDGRRAVLLWRMRGVHLGKLMNIPPTGREVVVEGASLFVVEAGFIRHTKRIWDLAGLLRALGLLPDLAEA